jgi:CspA family cold shock protein
MTIVDRGYTPIATIFECVTIQLSNGVEEEASFSQSFHLFEILRELVFYISMQNGEIAKVMEQGYGFIKAEGQEKDLFFHFSDLQDVNFDDLKEGDAVTFEVADGQKGPSAVNISRA